MKNTNLCRLLHAADPAELAAFPASSEAEKERILWRTLSRIHHNAEEPADSETFTVTEARHSRRHIVLAGAAACIAGAVCAGGILGLQHARPPLQPNTQIELETAQSMCPFGDIAAAKPWFTAPLTDAEFATDAQTAELREQIQQDGGLLGREFTIDGESLAALAEVFRLYGWVPAEPATLTEAQKTDPSVDFITMHLCSDPKQRSSEYLTACFNFGAGIIQVKTAENTVYYEMDSGELKRCMDIIVLQDGVTAYAPLSFPWNGIAGRMADEPGDSEAVLTPGRRMMLERMLR
ncbi:MAG: hypothetical protein IKN55_05170, partial [Oscillospiraceae bacterium]|nr:hypothetical protein [Oscillospiraceae bacterium]